MLYSVSYSTVADPLESLRGRFRDRTPPEGVDGVPGDWLVE